MHCFNIENITRNVTHFGVSICLFSHPCFTEMKLQYKEMQIISIQDAVSVSWQNVLQETQMVLFPEGYDSSLITVCLALCVCVCARASACHCTSVTEMGIRVCVTHACHRRYEL